MSRMANLLIPVALIFVASGTAFAQVPDAQTLPPAVTNGAVVTPVDVPPAEAGLSVKALRLNGLESDLALAIAGLKLESTTAQRNDLSAKISGVRQGTNQIPELIGISGVGGVFRAQFLSGNAMVDVGVGDWVSSDWRVARLSGGGIELAKRGGNERHQVLFGQRPVSSKEIAADIASAAANASGARVSDPFAPVLSPAMSQ